jgi:uncharacterized protein with HEPN domain
MSDIVRKALLDVLMSIEGVYFHIQNHQNFDSYQKSRTVKRAVERELAIIGEAINRILKEDRNFPLSKGPQIIAFRNRVIHSYDAVDDNLVWKVIKLDLPDLQNEITKLLSE